MSSALIETFSTLCQEEWQADAALDAWLVRMRDKLSSGDAPRWQACIDQLPPLNNTNVQLDTDTITIGGDCDNALLRDALMGLHPWRKGPYQISDTFIDCEWRSDWKWQRLIPHIANLQDRRVLDVGCGNGYHMWRMRGAGARCVFGVDPMPLFFRQFQVFAELINDPAVALGLGTLDDWPSAFTNFDTVFSMGVFYHRRNGFEHIFNLRSLLRPGGELILETLVIDGGEQDVLLPADRYAKMRNVWMIPSIAFLMRGMERCGLKNVRCVDVNQTSTEEQRATEWMEWETLSDFLDPHDPNKTIEGHPAPKRAIIIAEAPQ